MKPVKNGYLYSNISFLSQEQRAESRAERKIIERPQYQRISAVLTCSKQEVIEIKRK